MRLTRPLLVLSSLSGAALAVTVYGQLPLGQTRLTAPWQTTTVLAAYNFTRLPIPERADGDFQRVFTIQLERTTATLEHNISIPHVGASFWGFSLETSVVNQVLGKNSSFINVPFLNLLANLEERAGSVVVRIGGNTQEYAIMVEPDDDRLEPGMSYGKTASTSTGTTNTPAVLYTKEMLLSARKISDLLNVSWFLGIPFDDPINWRLDIAKYGQEILGDRLLGMQAANEPDFYGEFGRRPKPYNIPHYRAEFDDLVRTLDTRDDIPRKNILIGPSTSGQVDDFRADDVLNTGWLDDLHPHLYGVTVEHYSQHNCDANYGGDDPKDPLDYRREYLDHNRVVRLVSPYYRISGDAYKYNKPMMMFETNTASCGGFMGISNSFTAAMWGLDYGLQMAWANFTHALYHTGGQNVYYNPFTAPRTEHAAFNEWTIGPVFYSVLVTAEIFGKSNTARIKDLFPNNRYAGTPAYAIYEHETLSKVALFNYVSDETGQSDITVSLTMEGNVPSSVRVKYLLAATIMERDNITWAGQTFKNQYEGDGRLHGELNVTTIPCDTQANVCRVVVPAPGFALVFFDSNDPAVAMAQATATFATTTHLKGINTATFHDSILETSNGHKDNANNDNRARTNFEYRKLDSGAPGQHHQGGALVLGLVLAGVTAVLGASLVV